MLQAVPPRLILKSLGVLGVWSDCFPHILLGYLPAAGSKCKRQEIEQLLCLQALVPCSVCAAIARLQVKRSSAISHVVIGHAVAAAEPAYICKASSA